MESQRFEDEKHGEEAGLLSQPIEHHASFKEHSVLHHRYFFKALIVSVVIFVLCFRSVPARFPGFQRQGSAGGSDDNQHLDFPDITPSEKLEWHPCFEWTTFKCARLTVPMDYNRPLNASWDNPKVHIALLLVPGAHNGPKKASTSPLLLNPGGPGGSGVGLAMGFGSVIHSLVGAEQDVIGFDPRGIGATTPRADCFAYPKAGGDPTKDPSSDFDAEDYLEGHFHRTIWATQAREIGLVNSSAESLPKLAARAKAMAHLCEQKDALHGDNSIFRHLSTPSVARDMISIIDAWDEWTESLNEQSECTEPVNLEDEETSTDELPKSENTRDLDTKGKLVYWGFSYGTLLGATFAAMFPDRVGRVILDGVVDADHYVAPVWQGSIRDADKIIGSFSKFCHMAGEKCALYRPHDKASDVEAKFQGVFTKLEKNPITLIDQYSRTPVIVTINDIRSFLFVTLYSPQQLFPLVAILADYLMREDYTLLGGMSAIPPLQLFCGSILPPYVYPNEAPPAIMCSDKRYPLNETVPNLEKMFEDMADTSSFADVWMTAMMGCEGWGIEAVDPPMRWDDHPAHKQKPIKTSFPILFISNTADPVTPLHAGVKMARKFVDAGLIEQKSMGHCSIAALSRCTMGKIRAYFEEGEVPPPPTIGEKGKELEDGKWEKCEADEWPWHHYDGNELVAKHGDKAEADVERMNALKKMQETFSHLRFWGHRAGGVDFLVLLKRDAVKCVGRCYQP